MNPILIRWLYWAVLAASPWAVQAQAYPERPLKLIVGFPPGGNVDLVGRIVANKLTEGLGQQVVVENRTGAGSMIATDAVAKALPDGYTLLLVSGAHVTLAAVQKKLPYDAIKSFAFISSIVTYPTVLLVRPDSKYKTLADLVADARANPGRLNYPSPGVGTFYHLAGELMSSQVGIEMTHVPFRGGFEPVGELLAGRVDLLIDALTQVWPNIQAGKLRPLAIAAAEPSKVLPNVPLASQTIPGFEATSFSGLAAPATRFAAAVAASSSARSSSSSASGSCSASESSSLDSSFASSASSSSSSSSTAAAFFPRMRTAISVVSGSSM